MVAAYALPARCGRWYPLNESNGKRATRSGAGDDARDVPTGCRTDESTRLEFAVFGPICSYDSEIIVDPGVASTARHATTTGTRNAGPGAGICIAAEVGSLSAAACARIPAARSCSTSCSSGCCMLSLLLMLAREWPW